MRRFLFLLLLALCTAKVHADVGRLTITGADFNDGHYYVGPYHAQYDPNDHLSIQLITFCIDFGHHVGFGTPFDVTVVNLHNFAGPLHDNYWQAGWIALQMQNTTDLATLSDQQRAIWLITSPGTSDAYLTTLGAFTWATQAAQNYQSVSDSNFVLYLRAGEAGQSQLEVVPEPETYAIAAIGLVSLVGFHRMGRNRRAKRK